MSFRCANDELLPKQRVLGDEAGAAAHDVGAQPRHEGKHVDVSEEHWSAQMMSQRARVG